MIFFDASFQGINVLPWSDPRLVVATYKSIHLTALVNRGQTMFPEE